MFFVIYLFIHFLLVFQNEMWDFSTMYENKARPMRMAMLNIPTFSDNLPQIYATLNKKFSGSDMRIHTFFQILKSFFFFFDTNIISEILSVHSFSTSASQYKTWRQGAKNKDWKEASVQIILVQQLFYTENQSNHTTQWQYWAWIQVLV